MKTPLNLLQDSIIVPLYKFQKDFLSKNAVHASCKKVANFVFNCSKETALIMLIFNAVSIMSGHISQIGGLKKSNRENKDYLISQEKKELALDLGLTIVPPFLLNNYLKKKLESGAITTPEAKEKLVNLVAPVVGVSKDELYSTAHIRPIKETIASVCSKFTDAILKNDKKMPKALEETLINLDQKFKSKLPDYVSKFPSPTLEDIATDFDNLAKENKISQGILKKLHNGSAYDDLCGQNNGILIMATIAYTILASNVVMPILKNKLANRSYEKQLAKMGETRESIKLKNKFKQCSYSTFEDSDIFTPFGNTDSSLSKNKETNIFDSFNPPPKKDTFSSFNAYSKISSQSSGLRI